MPLRDAKRPALNPFIWNAFQNYVWAGENRADKMGGRNYKTGVTLTESKGRALGWI